MKTELKKYFANIGAKGGKVGGRSTSRAKVLAARRNGRKHKAAK